MVFEMDMAVSRRSAFIIALAAALGSTAALTATEVEAKRGGHGRPFGWSRGRKRGWAKRGGPKWRW
jgi:hypothetical protein